MLGLYHDRHANPYKVEHPMWDVEQLYVSCQDHSIDKNRPHTQGLSKSHLQPTNWNYRL